MTIEELKEKQEKITNSIYQGQMRSYTNHHLTNLSIEYAISVLEEILKTEKKENLFLHDVAIKKKKELQSLIK